MMVIGEQHHRHRGRSGHLTFPTAVAGGGV
jgi:hypothetical protein